MRGCVNFNYHNFDDAVKEVAALGYYAVNPADMDRLYEGFELYPEYDLVESIADRKATIRRDLAAVEDCDAIYMLKGWENSKGANLERALAIFLDLDIIYQA